MNNAAIAEIERSFEKANRVGVGNPIFVFAVDIEDIQRQNRMLVVADTLKDQRYILGQDSLIGIDDENPISAGLIN